MSLAFLDIGFWEIVVIVVVIMLVFGPHKIPELSRAIGRGLREFRKAMSEIQNSIEAEAESVKEPIRSATETARQSLDGVNTAIVEAKEEAAAAATPVCETPSAPPPDTQPPK